MRKIGVFGGTFNPIHIGHIHLALSLKEAAGLDVVYFSPNQAPPFPEKGASLVASSFRLNMVSLAIEEIEGFEVTPFETLRPAPSYTIDLVKEIKERYAQEGDSLFLLMAEDQIPNFSLWKEVDQLLTWVTPLVGMRSASLQEFSLGKQVKMHALEVSSSMIRERIKNHLYVGHLLHKKVLDYIQLKKLYLT